MNYCSNVVAMISVEGIEEFKHKGNSDRSSKVDNDQLGRTIKIVLYQIHKMAEKLNE